MAIFREIADHSVDHMFSLYFVILVISRFGFERWVWVQIASIQDPCLPFTLIARFTQQ